MQIALSYVSASDSKASFEAWVEGSPAVAGEISWDGWPVLRGVYDGVPRGWQGQTKEGSHGDRDWDWGWECVKLHISRCNVRILCSYDYRGRAQ